MKTNSKREAIERIAGPGLVLAALFAVMLSSSSAGRAQSSATSPAATPARTEQASQPAALGGRQPGGNHEGIQVHGHWTIEVRNPDGKLVSHTEFENALQPTGADALTGLLSGQYVSGGFEVGISTSATPTIATPGSGLCGNDGTCILQDSRTYLAGLDCTPTEATAGQCGLLTYTANASTTQGYTSDAAGFTLTGTVNNISNGGQIQSVASVEQYCSNAPALESSAFYNYTSQQCGATNFTESPAYTPNPYILTGATLPQPGGQCGGAGQPECAVTVTAGQSVSVSVQITFGTGATAAPASASLPAAK